MSDSLERLYAAVRSTKARKSTRSRTAKLLRDGRPKIAKKVVEEAAEVAIEALRDDRRALVRESADLLYNLAVMWAEMGIKPDDVWDEMDRRERILGIAEKVPKRAGQPAAGAARRTLAARK